MSGWLSDPETTWCQECQRFRLSCVHVDRSSDHEIRADGGETATQITGEEIVMFGLERDRDLETREIVRAAIREDEDGIGAPIEDVIEIASGERPLSAVLLEIYAQLVFAEAYEPARGTLRTLDTVEGEQ